MLQNLSLPLPHLLFVAACLALATTACQKPTISPQPSTSLVGEWLWVNSTGGLTGKQLDTPASTGSTVKWVVQADSTLRIYTTRKGVALPTQTGTYSTGTLQSFYSGRPARSLVLHLAIPQAYIIQELGSQLVVADNNPDGFTSSYQRQ